MHVHIVCYEDLDAWILGKFAKKLRDELLKLNVKCDIGKTPDPKADINHYITYFFYEGNTFSIDTLMITHIDCIQKVIQIKKQLNTALMGICMSKETVKNLIEAGLPKERLCYINPAQDGEIKPRKIVLGITHKTHYDFRKNPNSVLKICNVISPDVFSFKIMGSGWEKIVEKMRERGFTVEYYDHFDKEIYCNLIPSLDYYIYYGFDEGSMGYLDALAAGVKTIVTPQGYHLDTKHGITHAVRNIDEIICVLREISDNRKLIVDSVKSWTWENYAKKHLAVWEQLLSSKNLTNKSSNNSTPDKKSVSPADIKRLFSYIMQPLTVTTFLWSITPEILKEYYKKKYHHPS